MKGREMGQRSSAFTNQTGEIDKDWAELKSMLQPGRKLLIRVRIRGRCRSSNRTVPT